MTYGALYDDWYDDLGYDEPEPVDEYDEWDDLDGWDPTLDYYEDELEDLL